LAETVLAVASRAVVDACVRGGFDPSELLRPLGVAEADLADPNARIDVRLADAIWRRALGLTSDAALALHAAETLPFGAYRLIDYLAAFSSTVGEAVSRLARSFGLVDSRAGLAVVPEDAGIAVVLSSLVGPVPQASQEFTFTALVTRIAHLAGPVRLARVDLTFPTPADVSEHWRIFQAPLCFDAERAALVVAAESWKQPLSGSNPALAEILDAHARRVLDELPCGEGLLFRAREALADAVRAEHVPSLALLAKRLGLSARSLQRKLANEGTSFASLVDDARSALARAYLRDSSLGLTEIALLLGFADQSTFTRAFKRWTGDAPGAFRARKR
jgi:AraC-like DNA-binding protein